MERNPTLFGYGKTTQAIARLLGPSTFYDDNVHKPFTDKFGNHLKPSSEFDPRYSTLEIPSPGMPPHHPLIKAANHLISEYDLFLSTDSPFATAPLPFNIWISGTNGKTTTTQMMAHLLEDKGALAGGNIGTPLAALDKDAPIWILETSSFTLHYTHSAKPDIYALLPISPDHLSWHGDMDAYIDAKLKPLQTMREGEAIILPNHFINRKTAGFLIGYDNAYDLAKYFDIDTEKVDFKGGFLLDAILAMGVDKILYDRIDYERINTFTLDPHRQEAFKDAQGRLWVNDTKATNIDATLAALEAYAGHKIHLILGGDDKGVELSPLFDAMKDYDLIIYTIGSNEERLTEMAKHYDLPCQACSVLDKAVEMIAKKHTHNSVAMLSPAAASLDQFSSYAERGENFKEFVSMLS
ncbi:MAG: UDP-N-acetylmuramoyl-L-alanine--D-glutamate ligase [Campylobacterota bacterium]|nr:UDP-N-acetylmuramoyl-L-alanine--D-glutamate ligase [Campylobacterota bacterium]